MVTWLRSSGPDNRCGPSYLSTHDEIPQNLDEGIQEWRYQHLRMVQRTIGTKTGTGGSSGAEYLLSTVLVDPFFPDLWEVRDRF